MDMGRQREILSKVIDRRDTQSGRAVALSARHAMLQADFRALAFYEKRWVQAVAAGQAARKQWPANTVYHEARNRAAVIKHFDTLRVTDELTTAFEIALRYGFREGLVAMDWVLKHHTDRATVEAEADKLGRVKGIGVLRKVLRYAVGNSRSPFESYARAVLIERVADGWIVNGMFAGYEVDLRFGALILEIDGDYKYDGVTFKKTDETLRQERKREKHLLKRGVFLLRASPHDLLFKEDEFVDDARALLALAQAREADNGAAHTQAA